MKRKLLLSLLSLIAAFSAFSQTNVSGNLFNNTTWTKSNSPYTLIGDVGVAMGVTLTIEPGVVVKRNSGVQLLIKGALVANGASSDSIRFEDGYLGGVLGLVYFLSFQETNLDNSSLSFLNVTSVLTGDSQRSYFLQVSKETEHNQASSKVTGTLRMEDASFDHIALVTDGYQSSGKLVLDRVKADYSTVFGSYPRSEPVEINNSIITNSKLNSESYNYGIDLNGTVVSNSELTVGCCGANFNIHNSTIINSMMFEGGGNPVNGPVKIINSKLINTGIALLGAYFQVSKSTFVANSNNLKTKFDSYSSARAVSALIHAGRVEIEDSFFDGFGFYNAIETSGRNGYNINGANLIKGNSFNSVSTGIKLEGTESMTISENNFSDVKSFFIHNSTNKDIDARSNYFDGLTNQQAIENKIYHYIDNLNYGEVNFSNALPNPADLEILTPPVATMVRGFAGGNYLDQVEISFSQVSDDVSKIKVYSYTSDDFTGLKELLKVTSPFAPVSTPYGSNLKYAATVFDDGGYESWYSTATNQAPQFSPLVSSAIANEDESGKLTFQITSEETELIQLTASTTAALSLIKPENLVINELSIDGNTTSYEVVLTPEPDAFGSIDIQLTANDGLNIINASIGDLTVSPVNDVPTVTAIADITEIYSPDGTISIPLFDYFGDVEDADNEMTYEVVSNSDNTVVTTSAISSADGVLTIGVENVGSAEVLVMATDTEGGVIGTDIWVYVEKATATVVVTSDETKEDGTGKTVTVTTEPEGLNYDVTYNGLSQLPIAEGTYQVLVTLDERNYEGSASYEFVILPPNTAPTVTTISDITETYTVEGTISVPLFDYFSDAEDADNELSYEVVSNTDNTVVTNEAVDSSDGILTLNIENAGTTELEVKATDSGGASVSTTFQVDISKASATVTITAEETVADGGEKSVVVTTDPVDLNVLVTYNGASDLPTEAGTYQVAGTIDEENYTGQATYEFVILPANTAPKITTIADITETYALDGTISVPLFDYFNDAEDADNELNYEVVANTDNTVVTSEVIASADGILTLNIENAGTTELEVKATDSRGASVSTTFMVLINKEVATVSISNTEFVNDGEQKSVTVNTDPAGLTYAITYEGSETAPSDLGTYEVVVTVDDRNYSGAATGQMTIINIAPEDLDLSGSTVFENQQGIIEIGTLTVTDQNPTDTHSYSLPVSVTDNALFSLSGTALSATEAFDFETKNQYSVTVKVEDNQGSSYEEVFTVSVLDINDAPGATTPGPIEIVKDLGALSFTVSGLNTGGESAQTLVLSTTTTGVLANASVVANADGNSAVVTFESVNGEEGSGSIQLTIKDDGGTENGGVDTYIVEIPVTVSPVNLTVTEAGNCGPGEVGLFASGADGYSWYANALGGEVLGTGANFTANISASTTYYVAGTFSGDESLLRVPALASVFDLPEVPVITNNAEVLTVTEVAGATFTWFREGTEVPDITGASFAPTESGTYTVMITNVNGCTALSAPISVIITGFEEDVPTIGVTVYPVPSSDYIHLSFAEIMRKGTQIRLLDNSGKELTSLVLEVASTEATLDIKLFASGIHFITVQEGDKLVRKRVVIKK
ncbi:MAG: T9SS type A sorting domain-containing protein [Roseivirga sp.]|nr:T9SS type A sorting domain-containing protein [Roseivirga sp.]